MTKRPLIIESPDLQTLRQRYAFAALTLVFWVFWFYLWIPLISLLAWLFGIELFYEHIILMEGLRGLKETGVWYALVIVIIGVIFMGWSYINLLRFRGKDKRHKPPDVHRAEIARFYGLSESDVDRVRRARRVVVHHNEEGRIAVIDSE